MTIRKEHLEFHQIDLQTGWSTPPGYPPAIEQKILAGALDEVAKAGESDATSPLRSGRPHDRAFVGDYWEEVYLLSGDLTVGDETNGPAENFSANTYACRPPGVYHGPFRSSAGCLLFEIHYYD